MEIIGDFRGFSVKAWTSAPHSNFVKSFFRNTKVCDFPIPNLERRKNSLPYTGPDSFRGLCVANHFKEEKPAKLPVCFHCAIGKNQVWRPQPNRDSLFSGVCGFPGLCSDVPGSIEPTTSKKNMSLALAFTLARSGATGSATERQVVKGLKSDRKGVSFLRLAALDELAKTGTKENFSTSPRRKNPGSFQFIFRFSGAPPGTGRCDRDRCYFRRSAKMVEIPVG